MNFIRNQAAGLLMIIITNVLFAGAVDTSWVHKMFIRDDGDIAIIPEFDDAYGVAFRDINNDGLPDLYVARFRELNRLLINRGSGMSFRDKTTPNRFRRKSCAPQVAQFGIGRWNN